LSAAAVEEQGDKLSEQELISTHSPLAAGHETTVNLIGSGVHALLRHPHQLRGFRITRRHQVSHRRVPALRRPVQMTVLRAEDRNSRADLPQRAEVGIVLAGQPHLHPRIPTRWTSPGRITSHGLRARIYYWAAPLACVEGEIAIATLLRR
jgi:hypothetical protein